MSESEDVKHPIVMDNGSLYNRIGFAGDASPKHVFETAIGATIIDDKNKLCIGKKLNKHKRDKDINLLYPIVNGECNNYVHWKKYGIIHFTMNSK